MTDYRRGNLRPVETGHTFDISMSHQEAIKMQTVIDAHWPLDLDILMALAMTMCLSGQSLNLSFLLKRYPSNLYSVATSILPLLRCRLDRVAASRLIVSTINTGNGNHFDKSLIIKST